MCVEKKMLVNTWSCETSVERETAVDKVECKIQRKAHTDNVELQHLGERQCQFGRILIMNQTIINKEDSASERENHADDVNLQDANSVTVSKMYTIPQSLQLYSKHPKA